MIERGADTRVMTVPRKLPMNGAMTTGKNHAIDSIGPLRAREKKEIYGGVGWIASRPAPFIPAEAYRTHLGRARPEKRPRLQNAKRSQYMGYIPSSSQGDDRQG
jgi:hypothetical protein